MKYSTASCPNQKVKDGTCLSHPLNELQAVLSGVRTRLVKYLQMACESERLVSRDAQDALLDRNISLALNVKRANLDRLARSTGVPVAT
jgi:hypothetical protein